MKPRTLSLSKFIFYILLACLPINLGLHFVLPSAYVAGLLVDYLIPTLFIQDVLVVCLLFVWIYENKFDFISALKSKKSSVLLLLAYVVMLSTLSAARIIPSFYMAVRWVLYTGFALYVSRNFDFKNDFKFFSKVLSLWVIFLGILAVGQYIKQGSLFNNYLFLGEQPYSAATALIDRENFFGSAVVPAYGIFRHPNIFGGFLSLSLVLLLHAIANKLISTRRFIVAYFFGWVGLLLTFSYFSWASAVLGCCLYLFRGRAHLKNVLITLMLAVSLLGLFINKIHFPNMLSENPSVSKRVELLQAGYSAARTQNYLFGLGINSSTAAIESYMAPTRYLRFVQPPHNIFVLLLMEIGLLGLVLFVILLIKAFALTFYDKFVVSVLLLQVVLLSSFDHYFITIPQMLLFLFLLLGVAL